MKKIALWKLLIDRGLVTDRKSATSWVMTGNVIVDDRRADQAGELVNEQANIRIKGLELKYVGKGGLKLQGALEDFGLDVAGQVALDTGASTGGFTDCLLQSGAAKVYAIDVGYGQLAGKLRADERVINLENTNIGDVVPEQLEPKPTLITVDLSYLSLKKAIPILARLMAAQGEMLCLVKPLFEIADAEIRRVGTIENPALYIDVLYDLVRHLQNDGFVVLDVTHSHVTGNNGTREFFLRVTKGGVKSTVDFDAAISRAVESVQLLPLYHK